MGRRFWVALLFATTLWPFFSIANAEASTMNGTWRIENMVLEIFDCQQLVCGRIVWIGEEAKRPTQCGQTIVWGLAQKAPTVWEGGAIHDPANGKTYSLSATYQPDGVLRARIFEGVEVLGKTKMLRRVGEKSLPGWC